MLLANLPLVSGASLAMFIPLLFMTVLLSVSAAFYGVSVGYTLVRGEAKRRW